MKKNEISNINLSVNAFSDSSDYRFNIGLYVFKEGAYHIAYSPAFDLSSYAETFNEAIAVFYEAFQLHIEYCIEHKTLLADLKLHGFTVKAKEIKEPSIKGLLQKNATINKIFNGEFNYQYIVSPISIPVGAL